MAASTGDDRATSLVLVTTSQSDALACHRWLAAQSSAAPPAPCHGFYAVVSALVRRAPVVIADLGLDRDPTVWDREVWRLAELRTRAPEATFVVVADATLAVPVAGAVRADMTVTSVDKLPPLREAVVSPLSGVDSAQSTRAQSTGAQSTRSQTIRRRSTR
jgi:hypothetical protein